MIKILNMDRLIDSLKNLKVTVTFSAREEGDGVTGGGNNEAEFVDAQAPREDNSLIQNHGHGAHTEVVSLMRRINWTKAADNLVCCDDNSRKHWTGKIQIITLDPSQQSYGIFRS